MSEARQGWTTRTRRGGETRQPSCNGPVAQSMAAPRLAAVKSTNHGLSLLPCCWLDGASSLIFCVVQHFFSFASPYPTAPVPASWPLPPAVSQSVSHTACRGGHHFCATDFPIAQFFKLTFTAGFMAVPGCLLRLRNSDQRRTVWLQGES